MNNSLYPLLPPQLKKDWHITDTISNSAQSQVYIIKHNTDTTDKENKRILKITSETEFCKNIYKKIQSIQSPYIQSPSEIILYKHNYYIITRYQVNLRALICKNKIPASVILNIAYDISCSLKILHSHKILHMDCTPSNIYLNYDGSYCLGDFSSAVFLNGKKTTIITTTPGYTPPETTQGIMPGYTSDIYIFSCLLFTLFNNGYTIDSNNYDNIIKDNIPQELYSIILKGCSPNPSDRFSSIDEISNALNSSIIQDKVSNCTYNLYITDLQHPLYYLRTSLVNTKTYTIQKKQPKNNLKYMVLILITGTVFILSLYNYITKTKKEPSASISQNIDETGVITRIDEIDELDISGTDITSVPNPQSTAFSCSKLTILYANVNKIDNLDNIKYYTSLNELYLSDNRITSLEPLKTLCSLKTLVLSYNNISDLSPVACLLSLTNIDLSGNYNLKNINKLAELYNLKTLNLTNTNITKKEVGFLNSNLPECEIFY